MKVRVGIVGAGKIAHIHAGSFNKHSNVEITSVTDPDEKAGKSLAGQFGGKFYESCQALLKGPVDAVSICLPNALHFEPAVAAAKAGKHILVEKPMCTTILQSRELIRVCTKHDVRLMVGYRHRFHGELRIARKLIMEDRLGKPIMALDVCTGGGTVQSGAYTPWYWDKELAGGGILMSAGVHSIDRLRWLLGSEVTRVYAKMGTCGHQGVLEDNAIAILEFENGCMTSLAQRFDFFESPRRYDLELFGAEGGLSIRTQKSVEFYSKHQRYFYEIREDNPFDQEIDAFVTSIVENKKPPIDGFDGIASLAVVLAIYESVESGNPVDIEMSRFKDLDG